MVSLLNTREKEIKQESCVFDNPIQKILLIRNLNFGCQKNKIFLGHYICDIWCKKNNGWLQCNDEDVLAISETRVRSRDNVGYIYFYLNR